MAKATTKKTTAKKVEKKAVEKKKPAVKLAAKPKTVAKSAPKAAAKPAAKVAPKTQISAKAPAAKKPEVKKVKKSTPTSVVRKRTVSAEERWHMIAQAAYLKAESRGFMGGSEYDDWAAAESEIDRLINVE